MRQAQSKTSADPACDRAYEPKTARRTRLFSISRFRRLKSRLLRYEPFAAFQKGLANPKAAVMIEPGIDSGQSRAGWHRP